MKGSANCQMELYDEKPQITRSFPSISENVLFAQTCYVPMPLIPSPQHNTETLIYLLLTANGFLLRIPVAFLVNHSTDWVVYRKIGSLVRPNFPQGIPLNLALASVGKVWQILKFCSQQSKPPSSGENDWRDCKGLGSPVPREPSEAKFSLRYRMAVTCGWPLHSVWQVWQMLMFSVTNNLSHPQGVQMTDEPVEAQGHKV